MITKQLFVVATAMGAVLASFSTFAAKWEPLTGEELKALYSDTTLEIKTKKGKKYIGHYCVDGRGLLIVKKGEESPRTWSMEGDDQVCSTTSEGKTSCFTYVRQTKKHHKIKAKQVGKKNEYSLSLQEGKPEFCS